MPLRREIQGFSLIELMMAVAILGILASIAIPYYQQYVIRSYIKSAQSDLVALSLNMENYFQRRLSYPSMNNASYNPVSGNTAASWSNTSPTTDWTTALVPWAPTTSAHFTYSICSASTSSTPSCLNSKSTTGDFVLTATGATNSIVNGSSTCTIKITQLNTRSISGCKNTDNTSW